MRISTAYQYDTFQRDIQVSQKRYFDLQRQISSGKRLNAISDDPAAMVNVLSMKSLSGRLEQYTSNLNRAKEMLGLTENAMTDANDVVRRAYTLSVQAANTSTTQEQRLAMASEIGDLQRRLVQVSNERASNGDYIFSGQQTSRPPLTISATGATYNGDLNPITVEASATDVVQINTPGAPIFTDAYNQLSELKIALEGGNISAIADKSIGQLQGTMRQINIARGTVGSRSNQITSLSQQHGRRIEELTKNASEIEDVDITQAIMDLKSAESAYQAALQVAGQGSRLSLMDFIR